jgi:hypothetical protein
MLLPSATESNQTLQILELGLTAITITVAFAWPTLGSSLFRRIENALGAWACRKRLAVASVGLAVLLLRLAILPLYPIPLPFVPDDFSFLLAADTFVHGRLANPTPAMWTHFESIHITMQPTYMSMYFPGQGLLLAASKVLLGNPWFGILLASALMCAAICWMLQAWLPPGWALLGGFIAILRLGLFSCWTNTYHSAGSLGALAGALILGALPRLMRTGRFRYGLLMGIGIGILILTRPSEGLLLCLPVAFVLGRWLVKGKNRPTAAILARRAALPLAIIVCTTGWLGYYDYRAFGSPTTLPYTIDRNTYAVTPYYVWQAPRPVPHYRHLAMQRFYTYTEYESYAKFRTFGGFVSRTLLKFVVAFLFFSSFPLFFPLIMLRRVFLDRRIRFLVICGVVSMTGVIIEIYLEPYYLAPFTAAYYAIGLQAMRHLRLWKPEAKQVGRAIVRFTVVLCIALAGLRLCARPLHMAVAEWPPNNWNYTWFGPEHYGVERAQIQSRLEQLQGPQLAIVRYGSKHESLDEWVYNGADIDGSKVVWAREMDPVDNEKLLHYYAGRRAWLVEPDAIPARVSPYPTPNPAEVGAH